MNEEAKNGFKAKLGVSNVLRFLSQAALAPKEVGAILPSSSWLARAMADGVPLQGEGLVLELGAGLGVVTRTILERGIKPDQLLVIEKIPEFALVLERSFPGVRVVQADAFELATVLASLGVDRVRAIVSSLPLRNFSRDRVKLLIDQLAAVLIAGGRWIQFGYHIYSRTVLIGENMLAGKFRLLSSRVIWLNVPPARVCIFEKVS